MRIGGYGVPDLFNQKNIHNGMKDSNSNVLFQQSQKVELADKVEISKDGIEYLRNQLKERGIEQENSWEQQIAVKRIISHLEPNIVNSRYNELHGIYNEKSQDIDILDVEGQKNSLTEAYADAYKKIVQGYQEGTREVWVQYCGDEENFDGIEIGTGDHKMRYQKLTMEEELAALDKAYEEMGDTVESRITSTKILRPIMEELDEIIRKTHEEIAQKKLKQMGLSDNLQKTEEENQKADDFAERFEKAMWRSFNEKDESIINDFLAARETWKLSLHS